jgi:hypothetical protein
LTPRRVRSILGLAAVGPLAGICASAALADCRLELELLGQDLHEAKLTQTQKFDLAAQVDLALKHCRTGNEQAAMEDLAKARRVAGVPKRDWLELDSPEARPNDRR